MPKQLLQFLNLRTVKWCLISSIILSGCAAPQYAIHQTPVPDESLSIQQIEQEISDFQAQMFNKEGSRLLKKDEEVFGFNVQETLDRIALVTERPNLIYRAHMWVNEDPNAAALADGRIYISTGMLNYLSSRNNKTDELAFILSHELAHTNAQHLVKRYYKAQQQSLLIAAVSAGTAIAANQVGSSAKPLGRIVMDATSLIQSVANSAYSQEDELEADQLGIRYVIRAGYDPKEAVLMLNDFERFDAPMSFLRTHPYSSLRRDYLLRYLVETGYIRAQEANQNIETNADIAQIERLKEAQELYPEGSISWHNLQNQIDEITTNSQYLK